MASSPPELAFTVEGRDAYEPTVELALRTPGQRGILRGARTLRRSAAGVVPQLNPSNRAAMQALRTKKDREKKGLGVTRLTVDLKSRLQKLHVKLGKTKEAEGRDKALVETLGALVESARKLEESIFDYRDAHDENRQREIELEKAVRMNQELSRELRENIQRIEAAGKSWAAVRWTTDNAGAVGRGPPGRIAYSPFTMYDAPFEVQDVVRLLEEPIKRPR